MALIVACGRPDSFVQTERRDWVSARAGSSANAPVARKRAATSAALQKFRCEIRSSDLVPSMVALILDERGDGKMRPVDHRPLRASGKSEDDVLRVLKLQERRTRRRGHGLQPEGGGER